MLTDKLWTELCRPLASHEHQIEVRYHGETIEVLRYKQRPTDAGLREIGEWVVKKYGMGFVGSRENNREIWTLEDDLKSATAHEEQS